jgi:hypothetical protein
MTAAPCANVISIHEFPLDHDIFPFNMVILGLLCNAAMAISWRRAAFGRCKIDGQCPNGALEDCPSRRAQPIHLSRQKWH